MRLVRVEELAKAAAELAAVQVQVAKREVEIGVQAYEQVLAELRQTLDHERARGDRLEAELRKPWWWRLPG